MSAPITLAASVVVFKRELEQKQLSIEDVMRACADLGIPALEVRDEEGLGLPPADAPPRSWHGPVAAETPFV